MEWESKSKSNRLLNVIVTLFILFKVDMSSAKLVFGNRLLPTTLVVSADEARCTYSTKPAGCALDHFVHFVKLRAENFKVSSGSIAQSPSTNPAQMQELLVNRDSSKERFIIINKLITH